MKKQFKLLGALSLSATLLLGACSTDDAKDVANHAKNKVVNSIKQVDDGQKQNKDQKQKETSNQKQSNTQNVPQATQNNTEEQQNQSGTINQEKEESPQNASKSNTEYSDGEVDKNGNTWVNDEHNYGYRTPDGEPKTSDGKTAEGMKIDKNYVEQQNNEREYQDVGDAKEVEAVTRLKGHYENPENTNEENNDPNVTSEVTTYDSAVAVKTPDEGESTTNK